MNVQESDGKRGGEPQPKRFKVGSPQKRASQKKRIHFSNEIEVLVEDMMDTTAPAVSETVQGDTTGRGLTEVPVKVHQLCRVCWPLLSFLLSFSRSQQCRCPQTPQLLPRNLFSKRL